MTMEIRTPQRRWTPETIVLSLRCSDRGHHPPRKVGLVVGLLMAEGRSFTMAVGAGCRQSRGPGSVVTPGDSQAPLNDLASVQP